MNIVNLTPILAQNPILAQLEHIRMVFVVQLFLYASVLLDVLVSFLWFLMETAKHKFIYSSIYLKRYKAHLIFSRFAFG